MKAEIRKTLDGTSYRAAGSECGVDYRDLHKNAKRLGLRAQKGRWSGCRRVRAFTVST